MRPKISIIVPCYNQAKFLNDSLKSVLHQSFGNWECIIINDGSPDDIKNVAKKWLDLDSRFRYLEQPNKGLSAARNFGISHAQGKYILPLDADDKIGSHYIEYALYEFNENLNLKLVYCQAKKFGKIEENWNLDEYNLHQLACKNVIFCSAIFIKSDWKRIGGYDERMKYGLEDWEFWIALLKAGGQVLQLKYIGFFYRIKDESMVKNLEIKKMNKMRDYMSVKHADFFVSEFGSFFYLRNKITMMENSYTEKLKSEKYVIDLFLYRFFKFTIFGKFKP